MEKSISRWEFSRGGTVKSWILQVQIHHPMKAPVGFGSICNLKDRVCFQKKHDLLYQKVEQLLNI